MASKLDHLIGFYRKQLLDVGVFDENDSGMMCYMHKGKPKPVTLNKTRLVLPLLSFCKDGDWSERTAFHPLAEQISEGPSPVLNAFKSYVRLRMKSTIIEITKSLAQFAVDTKRHKGQSTKALAFMEELSDIDQKTVDLIGKILDSSTDAPEKQIISIYLQNKTTDGSLRACSVTFPIMDGADEGEPSKFFGFDKLRTTKVKDKEIIVKLLNYVLGPNWNEGCYTYGSKNSNSPYYHSLLLSFRHLAEHFNKLIDIHGKACENLVEFKFNLDWAAELDDFGDFAKKNGVAVPALPGNTGLEEDSIGEFEADGEDLGGADDLPWNTDEENRELRRRRDSGRDSDRDDRESPRSNGTPNWKRAAGLDDRDRDTRRDDRDSRRDDRRDDRVPNWKRAAGERDTRRDDRDGRRDRDRDDRRDDRDRGGRRGERSLF